MATFLWESIAFGPIHSRRLGSSLGINLLPTDEKICSFNCLYCECGWTLEKNLTAREFRPATEVLQAIEHKLKSCRQTQTPVDSITFSGNGEPTLHPQFDRIIDGLLPLRDTYYPDAVISCLSNATQLARPEVRTALEKIDNPILKLDAGNEELMKIINAPVIPVSFDEIVKNLRNFHGDVIVQTMFLSGEHDGVPFDNTREPELSQWLHIVKTIEPKKVMLYSLDRETPSLKLHKIEDARLRIITSKIRAMGIEAENY